MSFNPNNHHMDWYYYFPHLHMRKLRFKGVKKLPKEAHTRRRGRVKVRIHAVWPRAPEVITASLASIIIRNYFICPFPKTEILPYTPILAVSLCLSFSFDSLSKTALFLPALPINSSLVFIDPMASPYWYWSPNIAPSVLCPLGNDLFILSSYFHWVSTRFQA